MTQSSSPSALMVFLFTDLVDSTKWKQTLRDLAYAECILKPHNEMCRKLMSEIPDAREKNFTGDGFLVAFTTLSGAVRFALGVHEALGAYPWSDVVCRSGRRPETRIGIHLGEAITYQDASPEVTQITGHAVDLTARIMGLAVGGQTLLTRHAFDSARQYVTDERLSWLNHGQYRCKGSDDPIEVCEVGVLGHAPLLAPADSEKARRVKVDAEDDTGSWRPASGLPIPRRDGWTIDKKIGQGGFGEVWLARHRRTKDVRVFKFCFDGERLRSFKRELTIFRLIKSELGNRPDIATLHEVSVDAPPFFLEGDYVKGGNLGEWAQAQGGLDNVKLETRLRLIAEIARAVAAAHSLGIIHKDIKPSNILIGTAKNGEPQPLLSDFGIGILSDRSLLQKGAITETGFTVSMLFGNESSRTGTRLYSPPEANLGKLATTGFDIYALGVMLFQMVTGELDRPMGTGWQEGITRVELSGSAGDAVDKDDKIPHAADAIRAEMLLEDITAATHLDPAKRLPSAAMLAERLECLESRCRERLELLKRQEDERQAELERAAEARRAEERERRLKRLRRLFAVGCVVLLVVAGLGAYAWQAKNRADQKTTEAENYLRKTVNMVDFLTEVSMKQLENVPQMEDEQIALLAKAQDQLTEFLDDKPLDSAIGLAVRSKLARAQRDLGWIWAKQLQFDKARKPFQDAAAAFETLADNDPPHRAEHLNNLAFCWNCLGETYREAGDSKQAESFYRKSLEIYEKGERWAHEKEEFMVKMALTESYYAIVLTEQSEFDKARGLLDSALKVLDQLHAGPERLEVFMVVHNNLGYWHSKREPNSSEAKVEYQKVIDELSQLKEPGAKIRFGHRYQYALGVAYRNLGRRFRIDYQSEKPAAKATATGESALGRAEEALEKAHDELRDLAARFPRFPLYPAELAKVQTTLGQLYIDHAVRHSDSKAIYLTKSRIILEKASLVANQLTESHPDLPVYKEMSANIYRNLAYAQETTGKPDQADLSLQKAIARREELLRSDPGKALLWDQVKEAYLARVQLFRRQKRLAGALLFAVVKIAEVRSNQALSSSEGERAQRAGDLAGALLRDLLGRLGRK